MKEFPELKKDSHEKLRKLDEEWMKSAEGKKKWRNFISVSVGSHPRFRRQVDINLVFPGTTARLPTTILVLLYA